MRVVFPSRSHIFHSTLRSRTNCETQMKTGSKTSLLNWIPRSTAGWTRSLHIVRPSIIALLLHYIFFLVRWDPHREHEVFFNQSVSLYVMYYNLQILIHKPFIPSPRNTSPVTFPSLAICTNAARSVSHIVDIQRQRGFFWGQGFVAVGVPTP